MFKSVKSLLFNKYIFLLLLIFFPLFIGWFLLGSRLKTRTDFATYRQLESVMQIWGGNLEQPMPSIRYKGFGSDVASLSAGNIHASDVVVNLQMDYRKKGLVYYTGYNALFTGNYTIKNTDNEKIYLSFIFPYPMREGQGILQDIKLLINNEEDRNGTEYQQNLILWTGLIEPSEAKEMTVMYKARGLNNYIYGFEPGKLINKFKMKIDVSGASEVDYPVSTMTPTQIQKTPDGITLIWERNSSQSQLNIGIMLPDRINIARQCEVMVKRAPFFYLLFFLSLWALMRLSGFSPNLIQFLIISIAYFLFYPLFAYLSMYMPVAPSFGLSFGVIGLLIWNYVRIINKLRIANAIFIAYTFYLGITSLAALLPAYTGLILVIEGVVLIGVIMQVLSRHKDIKLNDLFGSPGSVEKNSKAASGESL